MRLIWIAVALAIAGCGGAETADCATRTGKYLMGFQVRSGTCGPLVEKIVSEDNTATAAQSCTGKQTISPDSCTVELEEFTCDGVRMTGIIHWNKEGTAATGIISYAVLEGEQTCEGTYDVTYEKF